MGRSLDDILPLHLTTVTFPENHPLRGQEGDVFGFAIRQRGGLVLFDTGVGNGHRLADEYYLPVHHSIDAALGAYGHRLSDVTCIVNSHLHFDHCGNNPLFPGVPIYAQANELAAAQDRWYTVREWVDFDGADFHSLDGAEDLGAGIRIVATPGHTPGHQALVVETDAGTVVMAGQAIYSTAECEYIEANDAILEPRAFRQ